MVIVRLPSMLRGSGPAEISIDEAVSTVADVIAAVDRRVPGVAEALGDTFYNVAVNDVMIVHRARTHPVHAGDVVEVVPTISGG